MDGTKIISSESKPRRLLPYFLLTAAVLLGIYYTSSILYWKKHSENFIEKHRLSQLPARTFPFSLNLSSSGNAADETLSGWSIQESWGTWTDGETASIAVRIAKPVALAKIKCTFHLHSIAITEANPSLKVSTFIKENLVASKTFTADTSKTFSFSAPLEPDTDIFAFTLKIENPLSPKEAGLGIDTRKLGIGVSQIEFTQASTSDN